jgi:flavin reductase (DIM6/NTAB) family NADH-FMN oxidoreductase RutF
MIIEDVAESRHSAVRQFASGVAVLTLADELGAHGTTVSALAAVSREPLIIGVCLSQSSLFLRRVRERRWFSVNVLNTEQAPLARWFADRHRPLGSAQFDGISYRTDPASEAPLIDGALSHLTCQLRHCLIAGDHVLLLATVTSGTAGVGSPLLSFARTLHGASTRTRSCDCRFTSAAAAGRTDGFS